MKPLFLAIEPLQVTMGNEEAVHLAVAVKQAALPWKSPWVLKWGCPVQGALYLAPLLEVELQLYGCWHLAWAFQIALAWLSALQTIQIEGDGSKRKKTERPFEL